MVFVITFSLAQCKYCNAETWIFFVFHLTIQHTILISSLNILNPRPKTSKPITLTLSQFRIKQLFFKHCLMTPRVVAKETYLPFQVVTAEVTLRCRDVWITGYLHCTHIIKGNIWFVLPCGPSAQTLGRVLVCLGEQTINKLYLFSTLITMSKYSSRSQTFWWCVKRKTFKLYAFMSLSALSCNKVFSQQHSNYSQ